MPEQDDRSQRPVPAGRPTRQQALGWGDFIQWELLPALLPLMLGFWIAYGYRASVDGAVAPKDVVYLFAVLVFAHAADPVRRDDHSVGRVAGFFAMFFLGTFGMVLGAQEQMLDWSVSAKGDAAPDRWGLVLGYAALSLAGVVAAIAAREGRNRRGTGAS